MLRGAAMDEKTIREMIEDSPFAGEVDELMAATSPAIRLRTERVKSDELPLGASRMGGLPDLPPQVPWPEYQDRPLEFLTQINFREAASVARLPGLPDSGWLIIFYDLYQRCENNEDVWRGLFFDTDPASLVRLKPQDEGKRGLRLWGETASGDEPPEDWDFHFCRLLMESCTCPPDEMAYRATGSARQPDWDDERSEDWGELHERFEFRIGEPYHLLGGTPAAVQSDPREQGAPHLLLQIDSDFDGPDWMWGDMGRMYFLTTKAGLAARDFSQVEASWDCY